MAGAGRLRLKHVTKPSPVWVSTCFLSTVEYGAACYTRYRPMDAECSFSVSVRIHTIQNTPAGPSWTFRHRNRPSCCIRFVRLLPPGNIPLVTSVCGFLLFLVSIGADSTGATGNFAPVLTQEPGQTLRFAPVPFMAVL